MSATLGIIRCDGCGVAVRRADSYVCTIEIYADPGGPEDDITPPAGSPLSDQIAALIDQIEQYSTQELMDQVHRRFDLRLCGSCQRRFVRDPLVRARPDVGRSN